LFLSLLFREFLYYTPFILQVKEKTGLNIVVWVIIALFSTCGEQTCLELACSELRRTVERVEPHHRTKAEQQRR